MKLSLAIFAVAAAQQEIYGTCGDARCDGAVSDGPFEKICSIFNF